MKIANRFVAALVVAGTAFCAAGPTSLAADLPTFAKPEHVLWLDQGWDSHTASWFHHVDQGTQTFFGIPYEWFMALEQPHLALQSAPLFSDTDYLNRHGFIPDDDPSSLPIGFAHGVQTRDATGLPITPTRASMQRASPSRISAFT